MMLCSLLSYVDRQVLAVLSPVILRDTGLSVQSYGELVSAFSVAYMFANPFWGAVLDSAGLRIGMLAAVAVWTLASTAHAAVAGFVGFLMARAFLGLGEGATFPGGLRTAFVTLPTQCQSRGIAVSYSGGSLGAIVAPLVIVPVAQSFGWRAAFLVTGLLGGAWLLLWNAIARPPYLPKERKPVRISSLNPFERRFWALIVSYSLGIIAIAPVLYLSPLYLNRVLHFTQSDLGKVLWIPPLGWEVGYFFWGWVFDRYAAGQDRPVRMYLLLALLALPFGLMSHLEAPGLVLLLFFWSMFITGGFQMLGLRTGARAYPAEQTASVAGVASGSWAAEAALMLPLVGRWFDQQRYNAIFWSLAVVPSLGVVLWLVLSRQGASAEAVRRERP
jgi:ACS family hexuronate transporter-like MFS transporter